MPASDAIISVEKFGNCPHWESNPELLGFLASIKTVTLYRFNENYGHRRNQSFQTCGLQSSVIF